jgi:hypothetical protein
MGFRCSNPGKVSQNAVAVVAFHIGGEDRRELSYDGWRFHGSAPPRREYRPTGCEIRGFSAVLKPAGEASRARTRFSTGSTKSSLYSLGVRVSEQCRIC